MPDDKQALRMAASQARKLALSDDPVAWQEQTIPQVTLWSKQREIMAAIREQPRVAVRSCHDSGKSFIASMITTWWLDTHPIGQARVITTAPTHDQVKGILWVEINQLRQVAQDNKQGRNPLPGKTNQTEWWIGKYLAAMGRKPSDYSPAAFSGMHARYMLIIIDEASGISSGLIDAAETLATNVHARILMIGNPDDPTSMFASINNDPTKYGYHIIKIAAWDTPNFTEEQYDLPAEVTESLLDPAWVERRRTAWGESHPFWASKIEAEFPEIDSQSTIKLADLIHARIPYDERDQTHTAVRKWHDPVWLKQCAEIEPTMGVDVAGSETGDETVCRLIIAPNKPSVEITFREADPNKVAAKIVDQIIIMKPKQVVIDAIGVGFGIIAAVKLLLTQIGIADAPKIIAFNSAQSATQPKLYGNARAELWWEARMLFQNGLIDTSKADNQLELEAQLVQPRYYINKGRIWLESKDDLRGRIGRSPDSADAFLYALVPAILQTHIITINAQPNTTIMARHPIAQLSGAHSLNVRLVKQRA